MVSHDFCLNLHRLGRLKINPEDVRPDRRVQGNQLDVIAGCVGDEQLAIVVQHGLPVLVNKLEHDLLGHREHAELGMEFGEDLDASDKRVLSKVDLHHWLCVLTLCKEGSEVNASRELSKYI